MSLEKLTEVQKKLENARFNVTFAAQVAPFIKQLLQSVKDARESLEKQFKTQEKRLGTALEDLSRKVDGKMRGLDGKDGRDGAQGPRGPQGERGLPGTPGRDGRDGIHGKDVDSATVKELREEIEKLKKQTGKLISGGGGQMDVSHWARHETFTMDGVDTTVTLVLGVGAAGNALIVRYQGQTLDMDTHYTVSGNVVTFVGFTPLADTIVSVTYWP